MFVVAITPLVNLRVTNCPAVIDPLQAACPNFREPEVSKVVADILLDRLPKTGRLVL